VNATGWSRGLEVPGGGEGVVSHAGLVLLRHLADKTGLTSGLSRAPRAWHRHFPPSRGPRGPEEAPDLAHHQAWTMGMQRPKLEGGLCAAAQAAGKGTRRNEG
jgi:hypothetical protein